MKILFFGLGSIGLRHARLLEARSVSLFAFRSGAGRSRTPSGIRELSGWTEIEHERPDVAFVCNPTSLHLRTALECAKRGMHLFIEKPIADSIDGLAELKAEVTQRGLTAYVAYPLRFHPGVQALSRLLQNETGRCHVRAVVSSFLPDWRPTTDPKSSYSGRKDLGGGVILDLSHEFDLMQYLLGPVSQIQGVSGKLSDVTQDTEDFADSCFMAGRHTVNLHQNFFSAHSCRNIEIDFPGKFIRLDLISGELLVQTAQDRQVSTHKAERDEIYSKQIDYFFENLRNPRLMNNLVEASPLLEEILRFRDRSWKA